MAEMLVLAIEQWNNDVDTSNMTKDELIKFNARFRKGDIVVVRPDGWEWGKEECLPKFLVIKTKDKYEDATIFECQETQETTDGVIVLKERKYAIPPEEIDKQADIVKDFVDTIPVDLSSSVTITEKVS